MSIAELNPKSDLLSEKFVRGFLPFTAYDLVNQILEEYCTHDDELHITFEGTTDEFEELKAVCDCFSDRLRLTRSERQLANAGDILPSIVGAFQVVRSIVEGIEDDDIKDQLGRYDEASSGVVPICVFGNCSSGKSTFINALIGCELLPSGDQPVTAKLFRISCSDDPGRGSIDFTFGTQRNTLRFDAKGFCPMSFESGFDSDGVFDVIDAIARVDEPSLIPCMRAALTSINALPTEDSGAGVCGCVDVIVPFHPADSWASFSDFVIFDTPGSNAANNESDAQVLREAMKNFTNGLPIFVCKRDAIAVFDNKNLCAEIRETEAIDERFAMVVFNKEDAMSLPADGLSAEAIESYREAPVPYELGAQGIYFASSVLGLGAKLDGKLEVGDNEEMFDRNQLVFSDANDPHYRQLFRYNILPPQIHTRVINESKECDDVLLANSGIYCVEREIVRFASRYAPYNKCTQVKEYLVCIIERSREMLNEKKGCCKQEILELDDELKKGKARLVGQLAEEKKQSKVRALEDYDKHLNIELDTCIQHITVEELEQKNNALIEYRRRVLSHDKAAGELSVARRDIRENLSHRLARPIDRMGFVDMMRGVADAARGFAQDVNNARTKREILTELESKAESEASDDLLEWAQSQFEARALQMREQIESTSQAFWEKRSESIRNTLRSIATDDSVLDSKKRNEIDELILHYAPLTIDAKASVHFVRDDYERAFKIFSLVLLNSEKLDMYKLEAQFNEELYSFFTRAKEAVCANHSQSFVAWVDSLLGIVIRGITEYNPNLREYSSRIDEGLREIRNAQEKLDRLSGCLEEVEMLMDWTS